MPVKTVHFHSGDARFCGSREEDRAFTTDPIRVTCPACKERDAFVLSPQGAASITDVARPDGHLIDLTPDACKTPEGMSRVAKAQDQLHDTLARCADALQDIVGNLSERGPLRDALRRAGMDTEEAANTAEHVEGALQAWRDAGNAFLASLAYQRPR